MNLQNITAQYRTCIALVFSKWGIKAPVTPDTVAAAVIVHKDPFIADIGTAIQLSRFDNADGNTENRSRILNTLKNILTIGAGAVGVYMGTKAAAQHKTTTTKTAAQPPQDPEQKKKQAVTAAMIAALVVLLLIVVIKNTK